jgi:formylglycine-generating enzyme required for sulfatase activity
MKVKGVYSKITPSVFALILLLNWSANAQQILYFKHSCSFDGDQEDAEIYADDASDEATVIVRNIMKMNVLAQNFIIKSGNVKNALAAVDGKQRFILYSTSFLESFKADENAKWAAYCLMAHEIGHHLNNDDMAETDPAKRKLMEIQADKFAGGILYRMGATLLQAQFGVEKYTEDAVSKTHPPKSARLNAVATGWKQMQESMRSQGFEPPKPTVQSEPTTTQKVESSPPSVHKKKTEQDPYTSAHTTGIAVGGKKSDFEPDMVFVKGGAFQMGQPDPNISCDGCSKDEQPVHSVTLSSFYIGRYEVTQKQWREVMGTNPSHFKNCGDDCPVENVSWDDVQAYLKKLNEKTGKNYRLPTEAEWEYAARGGSQSKGYTYSGDNLIGNVAWYGGNSGNQTQKVGKRKANELGIFDMSGNVLEWCSDWYNEGYYQLSGGMTNSQGPISGSIRVLRGGSWYSDGHACRSVNRIYGTPSFRFNYIGFRLVFAP